MIHEIHGRSPQAFYLLYPLICELIGMYSELLFAYTNNPCEQNECGGIYSAIGVTLLC